jgi:hypothetical protein
MPTPREIVYQTLNLQNPTRIPNQLWLLPWATKRFPREIDQIHQEFPDDIVGAGHLRPEGKRVSGDPYAVGESVDAWGCKRVNVQEGVIGEVKDPLIQDPDWSDRDNLIIPEELLDFDKTSINQYCRTTDAFVSTGGFTLFERMQWLRGTEQLMMDLVHPQPGMMEVLMKVHDFNCRLTEKLCRCDIDAIMWLDDWGAQNNLLIHPRTWVKIFKPLYQEYINIAKRYGKKSFMHSDGHILAILPHLIDMGLDAINSQIFCMGVDALKHFRGKITFWGEMDRQYLLAFASTDEVALAVEQVYEGLWQSGGCIAQCEFGVGAKPENVLQVFQTWKRLTSK